MFLNAMFDKTLENTQKGTKHENEIFYLFWPDVHRYLIDYITNLTKLD